MHLTNTYFCDEFLQVVYFQIKLFLKNLKKKFKIASISMCQISRCGSLVEVPCREQNKVNLHTTIKTKFGNLIRAWLHQGVFCSFSRSRAQGKHQVTVQNVTFKSRGKDT